MLIGAYFFGSIPAAYLAAKWTKGIDLRKTGSGNVGFTNLAVNTSKWVAIPVLIFDVGKGALVVCVAKWLGLSLPLQGLVGIMAIIGHNWSIFLGFNAGRGLLTTIGVAIALLPKLSAALIILTLFGIPFHVLSTTAFLAIIVAAICVWVSYLPVLNWLTGNLGGDRLVMGLIFLCLWLLTAVRRITAPGTPLSDTVSQVQLILNRLFLDRDIRDRKAWLQRTAVKK